jgi:xanthine dehydrogenase accessory factor
MRKSVFDSLAQAALAEEKVALGIITGVKGSSPQKLGAKALFYADGRIASTLGGGCLEAEVQQRAIRSLQTNESSTFDLLLDHDFGWDDGLICGGKVGGLILPNAQKLGETFWSDLAAREVETTWGVTKDFSIVKMRRGTIDTKLDGELLYQETIQPPCHLWIAGAGHIAQAVAPLALQLDFKVSVFDDRAALANHQFFSTAVNLSTEDWPKLVTQPFPTTPTFGLIVTRGHRHDALVLRDWIQKPFAFLGMIGSARKARIIFDHFVEERIATPDQIQHVACPVGIEINSKTVEEIAVSIVAQLIEKRAQLDAVLSKSR